VHEDYNAAGIACCCWAAVHGTASRQTTVLLDERAGFMDIYRIILQKVFEGFSA